MAALARSSKLIRVALLSAATLAGWTLFGLLSSAHFFFGYGGSTDLPSFVALADNVIVFYWGWALLTPVVFLIVRRVAREGMPGFRHWAFLALAGIAVMLLHGVVHLSLTALSGISAKGYPGLDSLSSYAMRHGGGDLATFAVLAGGYLLVLANRRARMRELEAAELESRLARADLELLRWHLHPHFLFNSLNTVSTLVLKGDSENAGRAISLISRYLRAGISHRAENLVPLADDLATVERYVEIERLRFGDALRLVIDADENARNAQVPSFILQPLVENAVSHGSVREPGAVPVRIDAARINGRLIVTVRNPIAAHSRLSSDNGMRETESEGRFGLRYVRERLHHFYGSGAAFRMSIDGPEAVATIDIPAAP